MNDVSSRASRRTGAGAVQDHLAMRDHSPDWHELHADQVLRLLQTDFQIGLRADEVKKRRERFGPNRITARRGTPAWVKFVRQFNQPLVYILLVAVVVTAFLGEWVDS